MNLIQQIEQARIQLESAKCKFNYAETEEDIDVAIKEMDLAETRLNRLLKIAKQEGVMYNAIQ